MKINLVETKTRSDRPSTYTHSNLLGTGLPGLAAVAKQKGHEAWVYSEHLFPITPEIEREIAEADLVGFKTFSFSINETYERAERIRQYNPNVRIVYGGSHASFSAEEALEHGDYVVRGAGSYIFSELLDAIEGKRKLENILGLSFKDSRVQHNPQRYMTQQELEALPLTDWSSVVSLPREPILTISTAIGCNYNCDFCQVVKMFGRPRIEMSVDRAFEEWKNLFEYNPVLVMVTDDSFGQASKQNPHSENTKQLYRRLADSGLVVPQVVQMNVRTAHDTELLKVVYDGGVRIALVGLEAKNSREQGREDIKRTIENLKKAGIACHGMTIYGADQDTLESLTETSRFMINSGLSTAQVTLMTAYPGTDVEKMYREEGRILNPDPHFWDSGIMTLLPEKIKPSDLSDVVREFYFSFYTGVSLRRRIAENNRKFVLSFPEFVREFIRMRRSARGNQLEKFRTAFKRAVSGSPLTINLFLKRGGRMLQDWLKWEQKSRYCDQLDDWDKKWEERFGES